MKINDIVLKEAPMTAAQTRAAQDAASGRPQTPAAPVVNKPANTSFSANYAQRNQPGFMPNVATSTPGSGQAARPKPTYDPNNPQKKAPPKKAPPKKAPPKKAPNTPVDAMAGSDAGDQQTSNYTGQAQTSTPAPTGQAAPNAELDRLKQLAIGGEQPAPAPEAPYGGAAANAMAAKSAPTPSPQANTLGVQAQSGVAFGQAAPQADNPNPPPAQAAQPAVEPAVNTAAPATSGGYAQSALPAADGQAAQPEQPAPDPSTIAPAVTSGSGQPIKTGTGGTLKSRSGDEIAWAQKFGPFGPPAGTFYPGAGNWDPRTGRTIKKETVQNTELDLIRKLSGLK